MEQIARVLRVAGWRVLAASFLRALTWSLAAALGILIVARLAQQLAGLVLPWDVLAWAVPAGAVLAAGAWVLATREDRVAVARRVDEGANLREALSTALCVVGSDDPWARLTVQSASDKARAVNVRQAVPIRAPRYWQTPLGLGAALVAVWFLVPELDRGAGADAKELDQEQQAQLAEVRAAAQEAQAKAQEIAAKLGLDDVGKPEPAEADRPKDPDAVRRAAMKQLTSIKDRIAEIKQGEPGQKMQSLEKSLAKLPTPDGPLAPLTAELSKANFKGASEELAKLMKEAQSNAMSPEDRAKLQEQLGELAAKLEELSQEQQERLAEMLKKAGLEAKLAGLSTEDLEKAIEAAKGLSPEQRKALLEAAMACKSACSACQNMGKSAAAMARSMGQEGMGEEGMAAAGEMQGELAELEQLAAELEAADAAGEETEGQLAALSKFGEGQCEGMGECEGGLSASNGPFREGFSRNRGSGSGGPGIGDGGESGVAEAEATLTKRRSKVATQQGPIISSRMVQGEQIKGESVAQFGEVTAAAEQEAAEALENNVIPREYHDVVKHYFGNLKARAKVKDARASEPERPSDAPAAGDAEKK
ncbi:MAG TPA: hypothetical protein VD963_08790 [Phycisphaerales bacterium]|nr:hypothetical protein [Phycisphaerales bacterium]